MKMESEDEQLKEGPSTTARRDGTLQGLLSLVDAVSDLVSATGDLVAEHLELARLELREDIAGLVSRFVLAVAILVMLFFGYCLLLAGSILLVGWGWGVPGMAIATIVLAFVHLGVTIPQAKKLATRLRKPAQFTRTKRELETTKQWMNKQIEDSSSKNQLLDKRHEETLSLKS